MVVGGERRFEEKERLGRHKCPVFESDEGGCALIRRDHPLRPWPLTLFYLVTV